MTNIGVEDITGSGSVDVEWLSSDAFACFCVDGARGSKSVGAGVREDAVLSCLDLRGPLGFGSRGGCATKGSGASWPIGVIGSVDNEIPIAACIGIEFGILLTDLDLELACSDGFCGNPRLEERAGALRVDVEVFGVDVPFFWPRVGGGGGLWSAAAAELGETFD